MSQETKFLAFFLALVLTAGACQKTESAQTDSVKIALPPAAPIAPDSSTDENSIRFYENKLKKDPEDSGANNKLAALYLQKLRETGDVAYLNLAFRNARASLDSVPDVRNTGGLTALALAEYASHDFANARNDELRLIELEPSKSYPQAMLGDALLELGEYEQAENAYHRMVASGNGISHDSETRFARLAQLHGDNSAARKHFADALKFALALPAPPRETVAWLDWQLGETVFSTGDYESAEKSYRDSLTTFPDYYRSVAGLGRALAARGDLPGAIEQYEKAVRLLPDPNYVAALGDLYQLTGRAGEAQRQYELVEQIGHLSKLNGALYNRQLALFYADHGIKSEDAYQLAAKEYESRRDIYGADALAWTALKAGKINEAQAAMKDALRLKTEDAKLFYHAGMILRAGGDEKAANEYLQRALKLNPQFDALQSVAARNALQN